MRNIPVSIHTGNPRGETRPAEQGRSRPLYTAAQRIFQIVAITGALMTTVQPVLGSFAFFRRADPVAYEMIHLVVGGFLYYIPILLTILLFFAGFRRRGLLFVLTVAQYIFVHAQLRLGLASNQDARLLAYHIPLGVLIFFFAYLIAGLSFNLRIGASGAPTTHSEQKEIAS